MASTKFTEDELKSNLFFEIVVHPGGPRRGFREFHGFVTDEALMELRLDGIDQQAVNSPIRSVADLLQSLEIIFRRSEQQDRIKKARQEIEDGALPKNGRFRI